MSSSSSPVLRFTDVRKHFGARQALGGLSLEVPRGTFFGLIGPNGAGKTTAFSLACGFLQPDTGQVEILGGRGFHPMRLKGRLAAMPQDAALGRETRCLEHLLFFGRLQGLPASTVRLQAEKALDEVGLSDRKQAKVKTLSHGMLRRLAVAQALLGDPELVLLDEPTSGLDPRHAHELRELLRRAHGAGRTLVVSSHNLHELESLCDHVAFIDRGVVVTAGRTDTVTGRGQEIEIDLGDGPAPIEALRRALPDETISWAEDQRLVRVIFAPAAHRQAEDVIGAALRVLLAEGARIAGVRRGTSLERRFLEMKTGAAK
jgi:ABC-type multidrug transport system ATPase subunit